MKVEYTEFKLANAGEFSDFKFFKNAYNVSFDKFGSVELPPAIEIYKNYNEPILAFSKIKVPYLLDGIDVTFALTKREGSYFLRYNDNYYKFSFYPLSSARTITQAQANDLNLNLKSDENANKLFFLDPSADFYNKVRNQIDEYGFCYIFWDNGDYYIEQFYLCTKYEVQNVLIGSDLKTLLILHCAGKKFRRFLYNIYPPYGEGAPQNDANLYDKTAYVFDNNFWDARWSGFEVGVRDFKVYPITNGFFIRRNFFEKSDNVGDIQFTLPSEVKIWDDLDNLKPYLKKGYIANFHPNLTYQNWELESPYNSYPKVHITSANEYSKPISNLTEVYALAITLELATGEEIPACIEMFYPEDGGYYSVKSAKKVFYLRTDFYSLGINDLVKFYLIPQLKSSVCPLNIKSINVYVAHITENIAQYGEGGSLRFFDAEKVPDAFFVLKAKWKNVKFMTGSFFYKELVAQTPEILDVDITLSELPVWGTNWSVPLKDETLYGNLIIGVGTDNLIYESHATSEGVMIGLIPEENFNSIKLMGQILKVVNYLYRLLIFSDKEFVVADPEKEYQIINRYNLGLYNENSCASTPYGIVFVASDGNVYITDGIKIDEISFDIKHIFKNYFPLVHSVEYSSVNNEVLILCGRHCFAYNFTTKTWSIYGFKYINRIYNYDGIYLRSIDGKIYKLNYARRDANGEKIILVSYKNDFNIPELKRLNYIELLVRSDDYSLIIKTDAGIDAYKINGRHSQIVRISPRINEFNYIQIILYSNSSDFKFEKIEVNFTPLDFKKTIVSVPDVQFNGIVLTCFNEHGLAKEKPNVKRYAKYEDYPSNPQISEYSFGSVFEEIYHDKRWGYSKNTDFNYKLKVLKSKYPFLKYVNIFVVAFWVSYNSPNSNDDENTSPGAKIYTNPYIPPGVRHIAPYISMKKVTYGRGGLTGKWVYVQSTGSFYIWKNLDKHWDCLWVYSNGTDKTRDSTGNPINFVRYNSYSSMISDTSNGGWYFDYANGDVYIKLHNSIIPDYENVSIVTSHDLGWYLQDDLYWDYTPSFSPLKHHRMPHPTVAGTPRDEDVVNAIKTFKELGYTVGFYPFLAVLTPVAHGWRGYITKFDTTVYNDYKSWILHYAKLFQNRQVAPDIFILGSEMKELEKNSGFADLIIDCNNMVKSYLPEVKTTYAIDWGSVKEILSGDTSRNYFENNVWNYLDYIGIDLYLPFLDYPDERKTFNIGYLASKISDFIERYHQRHPTKEIILTEYGISSVNNSLYAPYIFPPYLPPGSNGQADELEQAVGYFAFHLNFNKLVKKRIVKFYSYYNEDIRLFPVYPDAIVWNGWNSFGFYYEDWYRYPTGHNIENKLIDYAI